VINVYAKIIIANIYLNILQTKNLNSSAETLVNKDISIGAKISYYLKKFGLYDNQTAFWIKNIIEARNSVAHGRRVFYNKSIFPVQPFFPLVSNNIYPLSYLRVLAAKVISMHMGIALYDEEWHEIKALLIQDDCSIKRYVHTQDFKEINELDEAEKRIVFGGLDTLVLRGKIKPLDCLEFYKFYLSKEIENEEFLICNDYALTILFEAVNDYESEEILKTAITQCSTFLIQIS